MKILRRVLTGVLAGVLIVPCMLAFSACGGHATKPPEPPKTATSETNPLYGYEEIRELNYNSRIPYVLGSTVEEISPVYELVSGTVNHNETYRSKQNMDIAYTLSRAEVVYGETEPASGIYATGFIVTPEDKKITRIGGGKTKAEYITSRTVLGVKLGNDIKDAEAIFMGFGYTKIYEEARRPGLPMSCEFTFQKGILIISCAVEATNEISSMRVWIPMQDKSVDRVNTGSNLPADLGLMYSLYANPDFSYVPESKMHGLRTYIHKDGVTKCSLRGFPASRDIMMTSDIYFESSQYDVFGVKTGMTLDQASEKLLAANCTEDAGGVYAFGNVLIKLNADGGTVKSIEVALRESMQLNDIRTKQSS